MTWQTHSPDMETDSLQTQTHSQHLAAEQERVPAKETQTDPHNLVGFGFIFGLIAKACTWFLCQIQTGTPGAERKP